MNATSAAAAVRVRLTPAQTRGFWAAWAGWTLDGMDSFIFALVLAPALTELLPKSGMDGSASQVVLAGSVLFAVFLAGWGSSLIWVPLPTAGSVTDAGRSRGVLRGVHGRRCAVAKRLELGAFRFLAGVGIGGEWAVAGTYVAEVWRSRGAKWAPAI